MKEIRIRREPNGWYTVETVSLYENGHSLAVKPQYFESRWRAFWAAWKWLP